MGIFRQLLEAGGYSGTVAYEMCSPVLGGGAVENPGLLCPEVCGVHTRFPSSRRALGLHLCNPACQLSTTVMGCASPVGLIIRKRCPSLLTA
jgi:hypothetical protein